MKKYDSTFHQLVQYLSKNEQVRLKRILRHLRPATAETVCLLWLFESRYLATPYIEDSSLRMIYNSVKEEVKDINN